MVAASGQPARCAACGYDARQSALRALILFFVVDTAGALLVVYAFLSDRRFLWPGIGLMIIGGLLLPSAMKHFLAASGRKVTGS